MVKQNKAITIQENQLLEIPNDNIEIEAQEENEETLVIVDSIENQDLRLENVETVEIQDANQDLAEIVVKVKKPRVKKEKITPAIIEENQDIIEPINKVKKTRVKKEPVAIKGDDIEPPRQIEVSEVLNVQPELTEK